MEQIQSEIPSTSTTVHALPKMSELKSRASDVTFSMKLIIYGAALWSGANLALSNQLILVALGILILGIMFAHGVELQHQVLHNQGFKKRWLNETVGILLGVPMLVSFAAYQASHLRHHKLLGTPENKEFFDYGDQYGTGVFRSFLIWAKRFLMPNHYLLFMKNLALSLVGKDYQGVDKEISRRIRQDYRVMLLTMVTCAAFSVLFNTHTVLLLWVIPLFFVAAPVHALIEMPEHYRCNTDSTDVFENTRTIKSNAFMYWLTNGNNFHIEHHLMPGLPIDRLHDLHCVVEGRIKYLELTYLEFYRQVLFGKHTDNS